MYSHPSIAANQAYAGHAQLALEALSFPVSQRICKKIGIVSARRYLYRLCKALEQRLICPITVRTQGPVRMVTAFGVAGYRIDHARKAITGGRLNLRGKFTANPDRVDIFHPLCTGRWITWIIEDFNILDTQDEQLKAFRKTGLAWLVKWLSGSAYQILRKTNIFQRIRRSDLPKAFDLDPEIVKIALRARTTTRNTWLNNEHFTLVWKNEGDFRLVNDEAPNLLPIMTASYVERRHNQCLDPIQAIKHEILRFGISEASWRYLTKHGTRMFRIPWVIGYRGSILNIAIFYLHTLQCADLPPPPAASVVRTWLSPYVRGSWVNFDQNWSEIPNPVLRALLVGAEEHRNLPSLGAYCEIFHQIAEWSIEQSIMPDDNQQRSGWRWLKQKYDIWKARTIHEKNYTDVAWDGVLFPFKHLGYTITPITNAIDLLMEGEAMRNCLRKYIDVCSDEEFLVFSIREQITGKRLAVAGLRIDYSALECELMDVRGPANQTAKPIFWDIGSMIEHRILDLILPQDDFRFSETG